MQTFEILGAIFGILSVWLITKQNSLGWPVGILYIIFAMVLFFKANLYGELIAHGVFLILSLYGWWNWIYPRDNKAGANATSSLSIKDLVTLFFLISILSLSAGFLLQTYTKNQVPYLDSLVMILSFAAMWLSARKKIENWHLWILVNMLSIAIYINQGMFIYMLLYIMFLLQAFNGLATWKKIIKSAHA